MRLAGAADSDDTHDRMTRSMTVGRCTSMEPPSAMTRVNRPSSRRSPRTSRPYSLLWITSTWSSLDHPRDTTLRLMEEALAQRWANYWCDPARISIEYGELVVRGSPLLSVRERSAS